MDPYKCFGPDGSVWAEIQSRKASARVGEERSVDLRPPADNQLNIEGEMGPGGDYLHTWFREIWKNSDLEKVKVDD